MSDEIEDAEFESKPDQPLALVSAQHATTAVESMVRGETATAVDIAKKYPRSVKAFMSELETMATASQDIAQSCYYTLPPRRGPDGKTTVISGPSIRLAEMAAIAWGNIRYQGRTVEVTDTDVVAQGVAWDMQKNVSATAEVRMSILYKNGGRYTEQMISQTANAAQSKAVRNALLKVVPRAFIATLEEKIRKMAAGKAVDMDGRRRAWMKFWKDNYSIPPERVLELLCRKGAEEIDVMDMETLRGYAEGVKEGEINIDDLFPKETKADAIKEKLKKRKEAQQDQTPATTPTTDTPRPPPAAPPTDSQRPAPSAPATRPTPTPAPPPPAADSHVPPPTTEGQEPDHDPADQEPPAAPPPPERPKIRRGGPGAVPPPVPSHQGGLPD